MIYHYMCDSNIIVCGFSCEFIFSQAAGYSICTNFCEQHRFSEKIIFPISLEFKNIKKK